MEHLLFETLVFVLRIHKALLFFPEKWEGSMVSVDAITIIPGSVLQRSRNVRLYVGNLFILLDREREHGYVFFLQHSPCLKGMY